MSDERLATRDIADVDNTNGAEAERSVGQERKREPHAPLFHDDELRGFRTRWDGIQTGFVDEPRAAVEQADALVAEMMKRLADSFGNERKTLEDQWSRGDNVSTEDLRVSLKRYRSFFERLLSV